MATHVNEPPLDSAPIRYGPCVYGPISAWAQGGRQLEEAMPGQVCKRQPHGKVCSNGRCTGWLT